MRTTQVSRALRYAKGFSAGEILVILCMTALLGLLGWIKIHYNDLPENWGSELTRDKRLSAVFPTKEITHTLYELSSHTVEVYCGRISGKLSARFAFAELEGRKAAEVASNESCSTPGSVFVWRAGNIFARDNYNATLIESKLTEFIQIAKLKKHEQRKDNKELANKWLTQHARTMQTIGPFKAQFTCDEDGAPYRFIASNVSRYGDKTGIELSTRCVRAHQNFIVDYVQHQNDGNGSLTELLNVHQYNQLNEPSATAAFTEYISRLEPKTSFD